MSLMMLRDFSKNLRKKTFIMGLHKPRRLRLLTRPSVTDLRRRLLKQKRFAKRMKPPLPLPRPRKIITRFEKKGLKMVGMKLLEEEI
jgi:hypothetical protein